MRKFLIKINCKKIFCALWIFFSMISPLYASQPDYYALGHKYLEEGEERKASASFIRAIAEDRIIADYAYYQLFLIAKKRDNLSSCKKIERIFRMRHKESRWFEEILFEFADMYFKRQEYKEAVAFYSEYLRLSKNLNKKIDAIFNMATALYKMGRKNDAKKYYLEIWKEYPYSYASDMAEEILKKDYYKVDEIRDKFFISTLKKRAAVLHKYYFYKKEIKELDYIIKRLTGKLTDYYVKAVIEKGKALEKIKEYKKAATEYENFGKKIKQSRYTRYYPYILYRKAYCYLQYSDNEGFLSSANELIKNFKKSKYYARTLYLLYSFYKNKNDYDKARVSLMRIVSSGDKYYSKFDLYWNYAFLYYLEGNFSKAYINFNLAADYSENNNQQYAKALFWAGKSAEKMKLYDYSKKLFSKASLSKSFYGWLSYLRVKEEKSGIDEILLSNCIPSLPKGKKENLWERVKELNRNRKYSRYIERAKKLFEIGFNGDALYELNSALRFLKKMNRDKAIAIAKLLIENEGYEEAIRYIKSNYNLRFEELLNSQDMARILYPLVYYEKIRSICDKYKVNPFLIVSLIRQESFFNKNAVSYAGAVGLMQIMPATAKKMTGKSHSRDSLTEPTKNLEIGIQYLVSLLKRYDNNPVYVLSAYNAGERKTDEWKDKNNKSDMEEFIEEITFQETRNYIKKVLENFFIYREIYCGKNLLQAA